MEVVVMWSALSSLNIARQGLAVANAPAPAPETGLRLYAVGGNGGPADPNPVPQVETYDPASNTWTVIAATLPTPRQGLAAAVTGGALHTVGGSVTGPLATHEIYHPGTGTWTSGAPLPTARSALGAATGPDGRIYAIGGVTGAAGTDFLDTLEIYDPATGAWSTGPSMPTPRSGLAVCALGPLIYAIGGQNSTGALAAVEVYNPVAGAWGTAPSLPAVVFYPAASPGPDGLIYAIGGVDQSGLSQATVYGYDPSSPTPSWSTQPPLLTAQGNLAAGIGPDGRLYAVGGIAQDSLAESTLEVFDAGSAQPDPHIGNGTYQSPDIILLGSGGVPVPLGGAPGGAWDTLLLPNTDYGLQAVVSNDASVPAPGTAVRFWHFPGGVGTAGSLIDVQYVTVPAGGTITVSSASPYHSAPSGQHECVAVSVSNPLSPYFNLDPATADEVVDPTVARPGGSGHYGSAWRNTNSLALGLGVGWRLGFTLAVNVREALNVRIEVTATKVPLGWQDTDKAAALRAALQFTGAKPRGPLFLVPDIRSGLPPADDLELEIDVLGRDVPDFEDVSDFDASARSRGARLHEIAVHPGRTTEFVVSGRVPLDARAGDAYLVDVSAHYPATPGRAPSTVGFLEVIYVK
jgi:Kelch motif/Galactose oxidase, central domain